MPEITYRRGWWCEICDVEIPAVALVDGDAHVKVYSEFMYEIHGVYPMVEETTTDENGKPWVVTMIGPSPELLATLGLGEAS